MTTEKTKTGYDTEMMKTIERFAMSVDAEWISFHRNHTCCPTCGHRELEEEEEDNYVFYTLQTEHRLSEGAREIYLQHSLVEEGRAAVLKMAAYCPTTLHWSGDSSDTIYLTCDEALMKAHMKSDSERQERKKAEAAA
jgi:hypothetical protein